jgi:FkbM family methyltransferase
MQNQNSQSIFKNLGKRIINRINRPNTKRLVGRTFNLESKKLVELSNYGIYVLPDDYIGYGILTNRDYEPHVSRTIKSNLNSGDTFLDLGANIGYFTLLAASIVGKDGNVIAFEPNAQNQQLLFSSIDHNNFKNVKVCPFGASDTVRIQKFTNVGSNSGVVPLHSPDQTFYFYSQMVPADDLLFQEKRVDLIKMDVESHEPFALKGMVRTIQKFRPKIITEFHPWALKLNNTEPPIDFLYQLKKLNYDLSVICSDNSGLIENLSPEEVMNYWEKLNAPTIQLELLALPSKI